MCVSVSACASLGKENSAAENTFRNRKKDGNIY